MPTHDKYPAAVFLAGGKPDFRLKLAYEITEQWNHAQAHSFLSPVREGLVGTFFDGDPSVNVNDLLDSPIPGADMPTKTFSWYMRIYETFLRGTLGQDFLGQLAAKRVEENLEYFSTFIFDDADNIRNINHIVAMFEPGQCILVNLPIGLPLTTDKCLVLTIEDIVDEAAAFADIEAFRKAVLV